MKLDHYDLEAGDRLYTYEFTSIGPKGSIPKLVQFTLLNEEMNLYNLGFGDWNELIGKIDDKAVTDNGDTEKVLATVVTAVYDFYKEAGDVLIYAIGSTPARTRLYRMGINKYVDVVKRDFVIYGWIQDEWELYKKGRNYQAFLVQKKL